MEPYQKVRKGLVFTRELMEPFQADLLAIPNLESTSRFESSLKFSCKHPERFSQGTLRNEAIANSTDDS